MRHLDYPPVWLALGLALVWAHARLIPMPPAPGWVAGLGVLLAAAGVALMLAAAARFSRARTTIIPHRDPSRLVTGGVYRLSRNPIYLGDALILAGAVLWWQAWPALWVLPGFVWIITARFIRPEEARLRAAFGAEFDAFAARTRRWL